VNRNPDIVSLKWVDDMMRDQCAAAEEALCKYANAKGESVETALGHLKRCMLAVHQMTSTLKALGLRKAEMLSIEMERALQHLYAEKVTGERRTLTLGGLMQGIKVLPCYLDYLHISREDTGRGLHQYVNELRRWMGLKPRPPALFFSPHYESSVGISRVRYPAGTEEIRTQTNSMLMPYLNGAKAVLRKRDVRTNITNVARVAHRMRVLTAGTPAERYWFVVVALCEGIALGAIGPDECIASCLKAGASMIKYARETGNVIDPQTDYEDLVCQMLYYVLSTEAQPRYISEVTELFDVDEAAFHDASYGLIHTEALLTAINGAVERLNKAMEFISSSGHRITPGERMIGSHAMAPLEEAWERLIAADLAVHADTIETIIESLRQIMEAKNTDATIDLTAAASAIVQIRLDLEYKIEHGLSSSFQNREYELRHSVIQATITQLGAIKENLQHAFRRKALGKALVNKPESLKEIADLTAALHRHLNKTNTGHEELRAELARADQGEPNTEKLFAMAVDFLNEIGGSSDRRAIHVSLNLMGDVAGALAFSELNREAAIMDKCYAWLKAAVKAGEVRENEASRCLAEAFANLCYHLERSMLDPLDDTSGLLQAADAAASKLSSFSDGLSLGSDVVTMSGSTEVLVQDNEVDQMIRGIFVEESVEIVSQLQVLFARWSDAREVNLDLREMRRHFHTFKGNGRAVGARVLGELGWAAQDMLDSVIDQNIPIDDVTVEFTGRVVDALPGLITSYRDGASFHEEQARELTVECFKLAKTGEEDLVLSFE